MVTRGTLSVVTALLKGTTLQSENRNYMYIMWEFKAWVVPTGLSGSKLILRSPQHHSCKHLKQRSLTIKIFHASSCVIPKNWTRRKTLAFTRIPRHHSCLSIMYFTKLLRTDFILSRGFCDELISIIMAIYEWDPRRSNSESCPQKIIRQGPQKKDRKKTTEVHNVFNS